jgi:uncharacterized membrane protein
LRRRGISEPLAVVALVVVALAVGVAVALFATPYTTSVATNERLAISTASLRIVSGSRAVLVVGLANIGDSELTVTGISVTGASSPSCSVSGSLPRLPPGQSAEVRLDCTNIARYQPYVVSARATTPSGRTIVQEAKVTAQ